MRCFVGLSSAYSNFVTARLERHAAAIEVAHRNSNLQLLLALATLHDAVDASLADKASGARENLGAGLDQLHASNDHLTALGDGLVRLRSDLFESDVDPAEPLLAREPFFASMDYDTLYRQLAAHGAVLPHRTFWDDVVSRMRDGGARGAFRLLERHLRNLQSDLRALIAEVETAGRLQGRALGEALHDTGIPVARVMTGFTRLITTFSYVSICCDRAMREYEQVTTCPAAPQTLAAS
jgi:hypothetical protein